MENKQKLKNLSKIEKSFKLQIIVCLVLSSIAIAGFLLINKILDIRKFHEYTIVEDINLINSIDNIIYKDDNIILEGYAFLLDRNS